MLYSWSLTSLLTTITKEIRAATEVIMVDASLSGQHPTSAGGKCKVGPMDSEPWNMEDEQAGYVLWEQMQSLTNNKIY